MTRSPKFFWYELTTTDVDAALDFYKAVVGWSVTDYPGADPRYAVLEMDGRGVGGVSGGAPGASPVRPAWTGYVYVEDPDAAAKAIADAGGKVTHGPDDIPGVGRFAEVSDPQGTPFKIMKPNGPDQPPVAFDALGHVGWNELHSTDAAAGAAFYDGQFGWSELRRFEMGPMGTYRIFAIDGEQAGGMFTSPLAPPPFWMHYFTVADIDETLPRISAAGGEVMHGPSEVPGGGFIIQAKDPQGAIFAVSGPRKA